VRDDGDVARAGLIVEVEAYAGPEDLASHARFGPASRAGSMYGPAGRAYVYGVYGMHTCLNVVVGPVGRAGAILLRSVEPVTGIEAMRAARAARAIATRRADQADPASAVARLAGMPARRLARGPGNLAAAFSVTIDEDGVDLLDPRSTLRLEAVPSGEPPLSVRATPRVGVAYAGPGWGERSWRFVALGADGRAR
jgi:DNA-3-methyladenine glycosylase